MPPSRIAPGGTRGLMLWTRLADPGVEVEAEPAALPGLCS